jgi:hypothetical protein
MAGADFGAARFGGGAPAGSPSWGFAGNVARGIAAGDTAFAFGWAAVWGSGCGGGFGVRNLVGAAAGVVQQDSRRDGGAEDMVSLDRDAPELCRGELSGFWGGKASVALDSRHELTA